jgi:phage terminase small subunit
MPKKGGRLTLQERAFAHEYAATGDKTYAATVAGYGSPRQRGIDAIARPGVLDEIRKVQVTKLFQEALPAAVNCLVSIITDPKAAAGARVQASKVVLDRTLGLTEDGAGKEPHEMTSEELAKAIGEMERVAFERAKPVESAPIAQQSSLDC